MKNLVVITGASSGIGKALAKCFARKEYDVLATGRNEIALKELQLEASSKSKKIETYACDLTNLSELDKLVQRFQPGDEIAFLIHCAATSKPHLPLNKVPLSDSQNTIYLNALVPVHLTEKLSPYFRSGSETRVLFMGSDYVKENGKTRPYILGVYAISKTALDKAIPYLRAETTWAIGYVNPGSTGTPMRNDILSAMYKHGIFSINAEKVANPDEVAEFIFSVLTRASDSSYKTTNWDFRNPVHHDEVKPLEIPQIRAKL